MLKNSKIVERTRFFRTLAEAQGLTWIAKREEKALAELHRQYAGRDSRLGAVISKWIDITKNMRFYNTLPPTPSSLLSHLNAVEKMIDPKPSGDMELSATRRKCPGCGMTIPPAGYYCPKCKIHVDDFENMDVIKKRRDEFGR